MEPVLVAMMFADYVIVEQGSNKKSLIGTFNRFFSQSFPARFPPWSIYIAVTNIAGQHDFSVNLVNDKNDQVAVAINGKLESDDRSRGTELVFRVAEAVFPTPGTYNLTFKVGGIPVGSRTLSVEHVQQGGHS